MLVTGSLPVRPSIMELPGYQEYLDTYPGIETMADNLANAKNAMPTLTQWPRIVNSLGESIAAVLLGRAEPQEALDQAAAETDALVSVPA